MITRTGKVGVFHQTWYWFKQAYIRWNYESIPFYEDLIYSKFSEAIIMNYNFETGTTLNKIHYPHYCENSSYSIYQYYTQESYLEGKFYIDITINRMPGWHITIIKFQTATFNLLDLEDTNAIEIPPTFTKEYYLDTEYQIPTGTKIEVDYYPKGQPALESKCYFEYKPDKAGSLEYNLHQSLHIPDLDIDQMNASHSLQKISFFMIQMGTVPDQVKCDFLQMNSEISHDSNLVSSQTAMSNYQSGDLLKKSYIPLYVGLRTDNVATPTIPYLNYGVLFVQLVSVLEQNV